MIALLALHQATDDPNFLRAAARLGNFVNKFRNDNELDTFRGFQGGINRPEDPEKRARRTYASSEHNLDIIAGFTVLRQLTGKTKWTDGVQHARTFVEAMWDTSQGCFLAGTGNPMTRNVEADQLPLDVQAWSILVLPDALTQHPESLESAEANHRTTQSGFFGFDFNNDLDGVWFEGTAQIAVAYALAGRESDAEIFRATLREAQATSDFGDGRGLVASSVKGLTTGFHTAAGLPFKYYRRLHVGATAWNVFAQLRVNPYYLTP